MGDQPQNSIQLLEESLLKGEQSAIDELTLKKYHRQDRNVIITGIPRSGTSLLSVIINGFDNAVCLNEILYDVGSLPKAFSLIRKKLITGEAVPNKFDENGDLTTDTQDSPVILKNVVIENVDENVLIGSKVNIPYLNQLPFLLTYGYKTICLIRDPVYTIGSWCSSKASEIPEAKVTDDDIHPRWRHFNFQTKDRIERMVQIWSHYAQLLWNYRSKLKILTYEDLVLEYKREIEKLARFLKIENPPANLNLKNGNIRSKYPEIEEIIKKVNLFCPIKHKFKYENHDTKTSVSLQNPNSKRKIAFFAGDSDNFYFIQPIIDRLKTSEFETRIVKSNALSQEGLFNHMKWSDVSWFEWANGPIIAASRMPKKCKIICRLHRYEVYSDAPKKINWKSVDNLIFVSPIILDVFKEFHYKDIDKQTNVQIIPNALDLNNFKFNDRKKGFNIAYIARINSVKNPALMVQIISELIRIDPRFKCYMIGEIQEVPQFQYICHLIKKLGLQDSIIYEGICNDVDKWLNDKHFILSTSIIESQGLSIMEGMAKGLKPVIHNFFGMPDLIFDRKYVFDTIEQAVEMFLSNDYNPREYRNLIEQRYSLDEQVENIQKIILPDNSRLSPSIPSSNMPFISIIIPTFNRAAYINEAVESALDQKYSNFEVLILDDGSTDNTSAIISSINDARLRYIKKSHTGAPDTRNRAIKEASGDFIVWLGSDDILLTDTIQKYVNEIQLFPEVDVFYGDLMIIDCEGVIRKELKYQDYYNQNDTLLHRFLLSNVIPDGGSFVRKRLYQNFGGYNLNFKRAHDYEFWARIANKINVKHIGSFVYKWRWHDANMSSGSVQFDTSFDIEIKKNLLKTHSLQKLFPQLNWNEEAQSLEAAYFAIADSFQKLKGYEKAVEYYEKCLEIKKRENTCCALGLTYFQLKELQKALWAFDEALRINPHNEKTKEIIENLKKINHSTTKSPEKEAPNRYQVEISPKNYLNKQFAAGKVVNEFRSDSISNPHSQSSKSNQNFEKNGMDTSTATRREMLPIESKRKFNVLFVCHNFPPNHYGGTENYSFQLAQGLKQLGCDVSVLYPIGRPDIQQKVHRKGTYEGIHIHQLVMNSNVNFEDQICNRDIEAIFRSLLISENFDLVHFQHTHMLLPFSLIRVAKDLGLPVCLTLHDFWFMCPRTHLFIKHKHEVCEGPKSAMHCSLCMMEDSGKANADRRRIHKIEEVIRLRQNYVKQLFDRIDVITSPSKFLADKFRNYHFVKDHIEIQPLGITPVMRLKPSYHDGYIVFGYIGSIHEIKNLDYLVEEFRTTKGRAKLIIWGNGDPIRIGDLKNKINDTKRIIYKGSYQPKELPEVFSEMDVVVVPSLMENYPLTVREALSAGMAVIASNVGGIPEIIDNMKNGVLFDPCMKGDLAAKMRSIIDDPANLDILKKNISTPKTMKTDVQEWYFRYHKLIEQKEWQQNASQSKMKKDRSLQIDREYYGAQAAKPFVNRYAADGDQEFWLRSGEKYNNVCTIIIPVFNQLEFTKQCIESLYKNTPKSLFEVIVVDNNSSDGTKEFLSGIKENITAISNPKNLGFAKACNQGAKIAKGDYLVFLNNDTEVQVGWLNELFNCLKTEDSVAVVGAKLLYPNNTIQHAGVAISDTPHPISPYHIYKGKPANFYDANLRKEYQAVTGACMLVMKDVFTKANGFDENYINGYEDIDFCFRLREIGYKIMYCPTSVIYHHESVSEGRFKHAEHNIKRLHKKWNGKIFPDSNYQKIGKKRQLTSIIILTRNQLEYTKKCIESIFEHTQEPFEIIIVDNGSNDGTVDYIESEVIGQSKAVGIKFIKNNVNKGFAGGNNQGIAAASGDYILLLNNDVVVTPGWLERLIACVEKRPEIGIVGPRSNYVSGPQLVEETDYDTQTLKDLVEFSKKFADDHAGQAQQVLRVVGFCMLIKRAVIDRIGGMDDRFGLGNFEDDDFSIRAAVAGFQSWIASDCFVHHFGHRTFIGEKVDMNKSLHKNWGVFKEKWGLPADKPYGSPYRLSEMKHTRFDPSIHYYPLGGEAKAMAKSDNDFKSAETLYATIQANISSKPSQEIIEDLQGLVESYPAFALAYNDLGVLYYSSGNKEKAQKFYEKAVQLHPENIVFKKNLADFYFVEMGRVEEALQIYVKILERDPQDIETLLITGHICVALHQFEDAKVFYRRVLELEPQNEAAQNNLNKLNKMNPIAPEIKSPEEMYQEIQSLITNGDPHKAIAALEKMLQSYPEFALAHNDLGVLYYRTGDKEKARQHYERAVELMPDNINLQKNLADFLFVEQGKVEEALQLYVNILATHPDDLETLLITGHICVALKRFDDAKQFYERVLALEPGNEDANKNLQALMNWQAERSLAKLDSLKDMNVSSAKNEPADLNTEESEAQDAENKTTASIVISLDGIQNRIKECLKSIQMHTEEPHELLFIDRGATKGMLKWVQQLAMDNDHYHIVECVSRAGWAESINEAIQKANGDIIVLMHNDVVVPEGWLKALKMCIKLEPNIGVVGPMSNRAAGIQQLMHSDESDRVEFESAAKDFSEQNQYRRVAAHKLSDFCLVFRRELPGKIGYFDEQFFSEQVSVEDFCDRAAAVGYQNLIAADTYVYHYDRHILKKKALTKNPAGDEDRKKYKEKWNSTQNAEARAFQTVSWLSKANEFSQKGQIDQAVEILLNAIAVQPEEKRLYLELAEILVAAKRFQDAKDALTEMPSANGSEEIKKAVLLGYAEEGLENYKASRVCIEQVLSMNPSHARALNLKGILAYRDGDGNSAEKYFKQALASDPGYGEPYTNLGMLALEADRAQDALQFFEKAFRLAPTDIDIATNYHSLIAEIAEYWKAEDVVREAAALYPHNQKIKYMLIDFLVQQEKYEMAMPEVEDAIIRFGIDDGVLGAALKLREKLGSMTIKKSSKKSPISLCMIIKDEEKYLARCLASAKPIVDEIIVVDTGSADRSKDIAITFGAQVYDYDWQNDFAAARNFSISKASGEWILILDGDELISPLDYDYFNKIVSKKPKASVAYSIITRNYNKLANIVGWVPNDGRYPAEEAAIGWLPSEKVRLFYGKDQIRFEGAVHELVDPFLKRNGIEIKKCSIPVHHYGRLDKEKLDRKGKIYFDIGQKKLSEKGEDINALRELAIQATILEKNQEALELWQRLLALNPNSKLEAIAHVNMGTIYSRMERFEDALDAGQKAVACDPDLKEAQYNLAMAELHCGNAPTTIRILEGLLSAFPDYPPAQFILSAAYCCGGQKEKGLDGIRKLKNTPMGAHLHIPCIELGQSLLAAKKMQYAVWVLGATIECDMVNNEILDLFNKCIKMNDKAQGLMESPPTGLKDRQVVKFQDLPQ